MAENKKQYYFGRGRRKEASARVRVYFGQGESTINGKSLEEYFHKNNVLAETTIEPLKLTGNTGKAYVTSVVDGGGLAGQADAIKLGVARALIEFDENTKSVLKKAGFLTRDPREKERKKYGLKRARKAPQFSKR
jgi:small subunit ribosomal protein S9